MILQGLQDRAQVGFKTDAVRRLESSMTATGCAPDLILGSFCQNEELAYRNLVLPTDGAHQRATIWAARPKLQEKAKHSRRLRSVPPSSPTVMTSPKIRTY
jgi:hypothetical protein